MPKNQRSTSLSSAVSSMSGRRCQVRRMRLEDGIASVRPIAGTRPRGTTPAEDNALAEELLA
ncbi:MAG: chorismate-binding protein, partial [Anaerolineales bacterium]|nr:chorismate-binding protein [Anaerolineales bacterium]